MSAKIVKGAAALGAAGAGLMMSFEGAGMSGAIAVTGASVGAVGAGTIILATGGAAALVLVGWGAYKYLSK